MKDKKQLAIIKKDVKEIKKIEKREEKKHQKKPIDKPARLRSIVQNNDPLKKAVYESFFPDYSGPHKAYTDMYQAKTMLAVDKTIIGITIGGGNGATASRPQEIFIYGLANPYYSALADDNGNGLAPITMDTAVGNGTGFLQFFQPTTAYPDKTEFVSARMTSFTMEVLSVNNAITDKGFVIAGCLPNGYMRGDIIEGVGAFSTDPNVLMNYPGFVTVPLSKLQNSPFRLIYNKAGPGADLYVTCAEYVAPPFTTKTPKISAATPMPPRKQMKMITPNGHKTPAVAGSTSDLYGVRDCVVPIVLLFNNDVSSGAEANFEVRITRTWEGLLDPETTASIPVPTWSSNTPRSRGITQAINNLSKKMPMVPSPTPERPVDTIVNALTGVARKGANWISKPENQKFVAELAATFGGLAIEAAPAFLA